MQYEKFASVYDRLMRDVNYEKWGLYLAELIRNRTDGLRICECACGTGSVTVELKKCGFDITGTDISREMLEVASEKARQSGMKIPFVCMDMQNLTLHRPHDVILSACDGVNYLSSVKVMQRFFSCAYSNLKLGGLLMFDISTEYKLANVLGCNTFAEDEDDCAYIWKNMYDEKSRLIEMNLTFFVRNKYGYERFTERHVQRAHNICEIKDALQSSGFSKIELYDAFTHNAPTDDSERIQFVAVRE